MGKTSQKSSKITYKATSRFFDWIPADSPDVMNYYEDLKNGEAMDLKNVSKARIQFMLNNELIVKQ